MGRIEKKREKVLKLSVRKLRSIHDKEVLLCKSVLINNTMHDCLRKRRNSEARSVEDMLSRAVAPPPLIEDIEDLSDINMSDPDPLEDAVVPGDNWHEENKEELDEEGVVPDNYEETRSKPKIYRIQSNPKRDGRRNQTTS